MLKLMKAECVMYLGELKQYWVNYVFYNISLLIMFMGLFYSFGATEPINSGAVAMLYGLVAWQLCTSELSYFANVVEEEAMMGTLEQIFMTRTSVLKVLTGKFVVTFLFDICKAVILFSLCALAFGILDALSLHGANNFWAIAIVIWVAISFASMGLLFAGLALFYKRVSAVLQVITYVLLFFTNITTAVDFLPAAIRPISYGIPLTWGMACIRSLLANSFSLRELTGLLISSTLFICIGDAGFALFLKRARVYGKLGHY